VRTVDYSEVLNGSAALAGLGPDDVGTSEFRLLRQYHDRRLQQAWEIHPWPDLTRVEQRTFRPQWSALTTYLATAEVYDVPTGNYYQSLQAGNTNNPPTIAGAENSAWWAQSQTGYGAQPWQSGVAYVVGNQVQNPADLQFYQCFIVHTSGGSFDPTKFGLLTPFDRYIAYDQLKADGTPETLIGEIFAATDVNPKLTTKQVPFPFWLSDKGAQFTQLKHAIAFAWLYFRIRRIVLSGEAFDSSVAYAAGRQVYYVGQGTTILPGVGNFFTSLVTTNAGDTPESAPASWSVVQLPYIFRGFLIAGGYADWLTGDGQANKAAGYETMAIQALEAETDKLQRQQGQVRRLQWRC
jgi:hypothetical protein